MTDIEQNGALVTQESMPAAPTPMQMMQLAVSRGTSIEQLQQLMALQERWEANEARKAFNVAFAAFRAEAVRVIKGKTVDAGPLSGKKYAELYTVVNAVTPALAQHDLSTSWALTKDEKDWIEVTCTVRHILGHSESVSMGGPPDSGGAKNAIQARASAVSYLQRYTLKAICGVAEQGEDTDGARITPNAGAGDDLTEEQKDMVKSLAAKVVKWFASDSVGDAFAEIDNTTLDPEEKRYLWSLLDSKQRAALKAEGDAVRAKHAPEKTITDAQRKRLEARIGELKLDREQVKAHVLETYGKPKFMDLTKSEYDAVYDGLAPVSDFAAEYTQAEKGAI